MVVDAYVLELRYFNTQFLSCTAKQIVYLFDKIKKNRPKPKVFVLYWLTFIFKYLDINIFYTFMVSESDIPSLEEALSCDDRLQFSKIFAVFAD